jgi:hypothetical protein
MATLARLLVGLLLFGAGVALGLYLAQHVPPPQLASLSTTRARPGETIVVRGEGFELKVVIPEMPGGRNDDLRVGVRVVTGDRESGLLPLDIGPPIRVVEERMESDSPIVSRPSPSPAAAASPDSRPAAPARPTSRPAQKRVASATRDTPTPTPLISGADVIVAEADRAVEAKDYETAIRLYTEALQLDPKHASAESHRTTAIERLGANRRFVSGETSVTGGKEKEKGSVPKGFDPGGVSVKQSGEVPGTLQFDVAPTSMKPGAPYSVQVYLKNDGQKGIRVDAVVVASISNGERSVSRVSSKAREVAPRERSLILELPGVWRKDVTAWSVEVLVTSSRGDVYRNTVTWR